MCDSKIISKLVYYADALPAEKVYIYYFPHHTQIAARVNMRSTPSSDQYLLCT